MFVLFLLFICLKSVSAEKGSTHKQSNTESTQTNSQNSEMKSNEIGNSESNENSEQNKSKRGHIEIERPKPRFQRGHQNQLLPDRTPEPTPFPTQTPYPTRTPDYILKMNKYRPNNKHEKDPYDIPPPTRTATPARTPLPTPEPTPAQTPRPTRSPKPTPVPTRSPKPIYRKKIPRNITESDNFSNPENYLFDYVIINQTNFTIPENSTDYDITYEYFPAPVETPEPVRTSRGSSGFKFINDDMGGPSDFDKIAQETKSKKGKKTNVTEDMSEEELRQTGGYFKPELHKKSKEEEENALKKANLDEAFHANFKTVRKVPLLEKHDLIDTIPSLTLFNVTFEKTEDSPCHRAAKLVDDSCQCQGGLIGDGITTCIMPTPVITRVSPSKLSALSLNTITVYYKNTSFVTQTGYCKLGKVIYSGKATGFDQIQCEVPPKNGDTMKLSISFDQIHWSTKTVDVSYDTFIVSGIKVAFEFIIFCVVGFIVIFVAYKARNSYMKKIEKLRREEIHVMRVFEKNENQNQNDADVEV